MQAVSPKEANHESATEMRGRDDYDKIERQEPTVEILVSTEHKKLPPIFGTSCPPKGLSGVVRRIAFQYSEGQKAHWLLLLLADRINVAEGAVGALLRGRPDNPLAEMGLRAELRRGGFFSRFGRNRADTKRWGQEALLATGVVGAILLLRRRRREIRNGNLYRAQGRSSRRQEAA